MPKKIIKNGTKRTHYDVTIKRLIQDFVHRYRFDDGTTVVQLHIDGSLMLGR